MFSRIKNGVTIWFKEGDGIVKKERKNNSPFVVLLTRKRKKF